MKEDVLKERIIGQIKEPWDYSRVYEYVSARRALPSDENVVALTEDAAKENLLRMNSNLFTSEEFTEIYAIILGQKQKKLEEGSRGKWDIIL